MKTNKESQTLLDVWELKQKAYEEIKGLDIDEALHKRLIDSTKTAKDLGFVLTKPNIGIFSK